MSRNLSENHLEGSFLEHPKVPNKTQGLFDLQLILLQIKQITNITKY